jgi:hypothetical protein
MGRLGRFLTFLVVMVGIYFMLRAFAPTPLHDFLVFLDDLFSAVRGWVHAAEQSTR